jgi:hypothetical protein
MVDDLGWITIQIIVRLKKLSVPDDQKHPCKLENHPRHHQRPQWHPRCQPESGDSSNDRGIVSNTLTFFLVMWLKEVKETILYVYIFFLYIFYYSYNWLNHPYFFLGRLCLIVEKTF